MNMNLNGLQVEIFKLNLPVNLKKPVIFDHDHDGSIQVETHTQFLHKKQTGGQNQLELEPRTRGPTNQKGGRVPLGLI